MANSNCEFTVEFSETIYVRCSACGSVLNVQYDFRKGQLEVDPCETCMKAKIEDVMADALEQAGNKE